MKRTRIEIASMRVASSFDCSANPSNPFRLFPLFLVALFFAAALAAEARAQKSEGGASSALYRVTLDLDSDARSYEGTARVRWTNEDKSAISQIYFHLYPNLRANASARDRATAATTAAAQPDAPQGEPRLEVTEVRDAATNRTLAHALEDAGVTLRVQLQEAVAPGGFAEVEMKFRGSAPEIDSDGTSLTAHLMQQVGTAMRATRETRDGRHLNFHSRGVTVLGAAFPLLSARGGGDWRRKAEATVGDMIHADAADYEVTLITSDAGATNVFTSGRSRTDAGESNTQDETGRTRRRVFEGKNLRGFAIIAGRDLRSSERAEAGVSVRSVYTSDHERTGRRVLQVASEAVKTFSARFGRLPFDSVTIAEAPLVAGVGSAEFAGLCLIARAFYVDFDSPSMRSLPEIVREQRASVEDSLEFATAHMTAHQWWGAAVGGDPAREPVLDEALAHWSALLYYRDVRGEELAREALEDQLRGVYQVYRTFGGEDMPADRHAREYLNSFQYSAIVATKGALMLDALKGLLGEERFFRALRKFYEERKLSRAALADLRSAFANEAANATQRRMAARLFERWLSERRGDEDVAPPDPQLAASLGVTLEKGEAKDRNAFARLGKFFWRQMTRIR